MTIPGLPSSPIRPAELADRAAITDIARAGGLFTTDDLADIDGSLTAYLRDETIADRWVVHASGGHVTALAYYAPERMTDGTFNLYLLAVHPDSQRNGDGAALVQHIEEDLRARGGRVLLIETSGVPEFAGQRIFYTRLGYAEEARIRDFYASGDDKAVYSKHL